MKTEISFRVSALRLAALQKASNIALLEMMEQRIMLSATPLVTLPYTTAGSNPSVMYAVNGTTLFFADDSTGPQHLYQTDGTAVGTKLVSTQSLHTNSSGGADAVVSGDNLFYVTDTGNGQQVEEATVGSDGTVTMTQFTNVTPDDNLDRYDIAGIAAVGSNVYFATNDNSNASGDNTPLSLWVTDGTNSTKLASFAEIDEVSAINGKAIFAADNGTNGDQLFVSDGTVSGTVPLQQSGGGEVNEPIDFTPDGTNLFFVANGSALYYTDGTQAGTKEANAPENVEVNGTSAELNTSEHLSVLSGDVYYNNNQYLYKTSADGQTTTEVSATVAEPYYLEPMGGEIYFQGFDAQHGHELWKTDGTSGGTELVEDINSGTGSSWPEDLVASGNELFFQAEPDGQDSHEQVFASDGTNVNQLTTNIGDTNGFDNQLSAGAASGVAYMSFNDGFHGSEPFKLTSNSASLLSDVNSTPANSSSAPQDGTTQVGNTIYFVSGNDDSQTLWKTDGTVAGTVNITPPVAIGSGDSATTASLVNGMEITNLLGGSSVLYFESDADGTPGALWMYNGTTAVPVQYIPSGSTTPTDIVIGNNSAVVGNTLFFDFNDGTDGDELWMSDGTVTGTKMVKDVNLGGGGSNPESLNVLGNKLLFTADDGSGAGRELWASDGTSMGTVAIKHLAPGTATFDFQNFAVVGSNAYLTIDDLDQVYMWKTDGTAAGTVNVGIFNEVDLPDYGVPGQNVGTAPVIGGDFFFAAESTTDENNGTSLWKTDGTLAGTVVVKSGRSGFEDDGFDPENIVNQNPTTIMMEAYGPDGEELWKSDGTTDGTVQVKDIYPGQLGSSPYDLTPLNGEVYFAATTGDTGIFGTDHELWKSDGTAAGTVQVAQIYSAHGRYTSGGADVNNITIAGSKIFFTANDGVHGNELWESDGTTAGTFLVQDINPTDYANPEDLKVATTPVGDHALVFFADDGIRGDQPYSVTVPVYNVNVSTNAISVPENGSNSFTVVLSAQPSSDVTVTISKESGGSADLGTAATTLLFTSSNWNTPQTVTVNGAIDDGALGSTAVFDVSTPNLTKQTVTATETAASSSIVVLRATSLNVTEGSSNTFKVHLSAAPLTQETVTVTFASGDNVLSSSPATLVFTPSNFGTDQTVTITSGTDVDTNNDTAAFTVSANGFPDQTVTATQIDTSGPVVGQFTVTPSSGTSKSTIKLIASGVKGDGGVGLASSVIFYIDTNRNGVLDSGDATLKTVKPTKKGTAAYALKAKTLSAGATTFFAQAVDSSGTKGQPASGTFTLSTVKASKKKHASVRSMTMITAASAQTTNTQADGITESMFSQMPILG